MPELKGYIFKCNEPFDDDGTLKTDPQNYGYYLGYGTGYTSDRELAYVYNVSEIKDLFSPSWGHKRLGKWIAIYE